MREFWQTETIESEDKLSMRVMIRVGPTGDGTAASVKLREDSGHVMDKNVQEVLECRCKSSATSAVVGTRQAGNEAKARETAGGPYATALDACLRIIDKQLEGKI